jgi:predicted XRE-type DNA-binding protein
MDDLDEITTGSGNVYADLGYADPQLARAKADLIRGIVAIIEERGLTQAQAAKLLESDQPTVSHLFRGHVSRFGLERLLRCLIRLDHDIEIITVPTELTGAVPHIAVRGLVPAR